MNEGSLWQLNDLRHQAKIIDRKIAEIILGCDHRFSDRSSAKKMSGVNFMICTICFDKWVLIGGETK